MFFLLAFFGITGGAEAEGIDPKHPVKVYAKLDGKWRGTFVGYDAQGKELYRIRVEQRYKTVSSTVQKVEIRDTDMKTGKTVTGEGENIARIREDGTLELLCVVRKSNGDTVEHQGRLVKGADGEEQLVWYTQKADRSETFREVVRKENGVEVYSIDGMGRYGGTLILMHGRYARVKEPSK